MCIVVPQELVVAGQVLVGAYIAFWLVVIAGVGLDRLRRRFEA